MSGIQSRGEPRHGYWKVKNSRGWYGEVALRRLITSRKGRFTWRTPSENPYILRDDTRRIIESRYADVTFAMSNT